MYIIKSINFPQPAHYVDYTYIRLYTFTEFQWIDEAHKRPLAAVVLPLKFLFHELK